MDNSNEVDANSNTKFSNILDKDLNPDETSEIINPDNNNNDNTNNLEDEMKPIEQKIDKLVLLDGDKNNEEIAVGDGEGEQEVDEEEEEDEDAEEEEEEEEEEDSSELTASEEDETTWITWFCNLKGNDFFCKIDEDYIQDEFNLTGLSALVPYYEYALDMMLDVDIPIENLSDEQQEMIETASELLYGLIHARFILTSRGMQRMYEKFRNVDFGRCPRVYCQGQSILPVGLSDIPRQYSAHVYCPRCQEIYYPRNSRQANLDGSFFGTTFPHLFLLQHPETIPFKNEQMYVPRIYGFRINSESQYYKPPHLLQQMQNARNGGNGNGKDGRSSRDNKRNNGNNSTSVSAQQTSESQRERDRRR